MTSQQARAESIRVQFERQCAAGRHVMGCPHRPINCRWAELELAHVLPPKEKPHA